MRALQAQHAEAQSLLAAETAVEPPSSAQFGQPSGAVPLQQIGPSSAGDPEIAGTFVRSERKVGRNEPCPCGSGKKFKNCHGALSGIG